MVEGKELVEEVGDVLVSQANGLKLMGVVRQAVGASATLQMEEGIDSLVGDERGLAGMIVVGGGGGRRGHFVAVIHGVSLGLRAVEVSSESVNFLFHLGVLGALANALEVGLDLALELEADAARAGLPGILYNIAA